MKVSVFLQEVKRIGINTIAGVPDSTLKQFCDAVQLDRGREFRHYVTANEGAAIGLATGEYLASKKPSLVYMQNSGMGNSLNPLVSIANPEVYGIPMLLVIGWRGEPGTKDEPQHIYQGKITCELLKVLGIQYAVIDAETTEEEIREVFDKACTVLNNNSQYAIVVKKGCFEKTSEYAWENGYRLSREQVLKVILEKFYENSYIVSTTGKISRELYEQSDALYGNHNRLFMTVGGMGHASMIACGMALTGTTKKIVCIDGDGAVLMHMGALAFIAKQAPSNLVHIVINNKAHESVGAVPTGFSGRAYAPVAASCGYPQTYIVRTDSELKGAFDDAQKINKLLMIEIMVSLEARENLGRPRETAAENKINFMNVYHEKN